ncbi:hypothetical protein FSP39_024336 [Pinctada imbricata]|uniref:Methyltransferase FkbM domain-containing protein n=1 Tax=Pinctada imbricata TaxID=66713 RepID=A0AA88YSQ5_PINIB|nr:hypothetical protein FSP39_024336 [Pinctada imbricata]
MRQTSVKIGIIVLIVLMLFFLVYEKDDRIQTPSRADYADNTRNIAFASADLSENKICNSLSIPLQHEITQYKKIERQLTDSEHEAVVVCRKRDLKEEHKQSWETFFANKVEYIRWNNHTYLNGDSTVVEVGGNVGAFSDKILSLFNPRRYIILEPMTKYSGMLVGKYKGVQNVMVLNFGLASEDRTDWVKLDGIETSRFQNNNIPKNQLSPLRQVNATDFFLSMGVGIYEVDLLTMNCEGCEYDILDAILDSNLINYFRHVQISYHHLNGLGDTLDRWCQYQQLLSRTHRLIYQYPFFWELWTRKDLKQ